MTIFLVGCDNPHRMWLAVTAGHWNLCFRFRRRVSSCFYWVWRAIATCRNCRHFQFEVRREMSGIMSGFHHCHEHEIRAGCGGDMQCYQRQRGRCCNISRVNPSRSVANAYFTARATAPRHPLVCVFAVCRLE